MMILHLPCKPLLRPGQVTFVAAALVPSRKKKSFKLTKVAKICGIGK